MTWETVVKHNSRKHGFTLIELLVVVSIIALLVSILLPALGRAKQIAKRTLCASNLHASGLCLHIYANDNDDRLPIRNKDFELRYLLYDPYYKALASSTDNVKIFVCPEFDKSYYRSRLVSWCAEDDRNRVYDMEPFPAEWDGGTGMYLGYAYIGGKRQNGYVSDSGTTVPAWDWDTLLAYGGVKWTSPLRTSESAGLALMADHIELNDSCIEATHRKGGYERDYGLYVEPTEFDVLGGNMLMLGGSVHWRDVYDLEKHPRSNPAVSGAYSYAYW